MKRCNTRRVQAQRKFAQGAYAPAASSSGVGVEKKPVEPPKERNIIRNNVPAKTLLDVVSFKNIHPHLQPVVRIERMDNIDTNRKQNNVEPTQEKNKLPIVKERIVRAKKTHIRHSWDMTLRSRSEVKKLTKQNTNVRKRKNVVLEVQNVKRKRDCTENFTSDDYKPLTYFAKTAVKINRTETKKRVLKKHNFKKPKNVITKKTLERVKQALQLPVSSASSQHQVAESTSQQDPVRVANTPDPIARTTLEDTIAAPTMVAVVEPQPGPSRLPASSDFIRLEEQETIVPAVSDSSFSELAYHDSDAAGPYYNEHGIQRWITGAQLTPDPPTGPQNDLNADRGPTPARCPAIAWDTLKQVMDAPNEILEKRCKQCNTCVKIAKLFMLSRILRKHREVECTGGEDENCEQPPAALPKDDTMVSLDGDLFMELLPKHAHLIIKLKIQTVHDKQLLSARLVPRSAAHNNISKDLSLVEHEIILDQVIKMLSTNIVAPTSVCAQPVESTSRIVTGMNVDPVVDLTQGDSKCSVRSEGRSDTGSQSSSFPKSVDRAKLVDAPVFYPTKEEFADPISYFEKIAPVASKYGLCKVIPPPSHRFAPKCKIDDEIRFDVINQYISRLYNRWGPAARELCAIKACLKTQSLNLTRSPLLDGIEVNLPKLYHVVQRNGGLEKVINKNRWGRVAEEMSFTKTPNPERKLDNIYVKYLLPYDTLAHKERQEIIRKVEKHWNKRNQKMLDRALNPLHRQKRLLGESESSGEDTGDESEVGNALAEAEDCIVPGSCMNLIKFKRVAAIALENNFRSSTAPSLEAVEELYWRLVLLGTEHVCVNTASIDTGEEGYGFSKNKQDPYSKHPWNLKMLSQNSRNVLRSLGPVLGLTVPSLHLGMVFSTSCWHSDPHGLPWIEYMHQGSPKIWYGIPNEQSQNFRKAVETLCPTSCQNKSIWLPSDISMIPPTLLLEHNVSLSKLSQNPGEFIMVYPKAYSCSISTGYTLSESVYFATNSWLNTVHLVFQELRESCEPTMFSLEQLLLAVAQDPRTPLSVLQQAHATLSTIISDELRCRKELRVMKLPFIEDKNREHIANKKPRNTSAWNVRDLNECEVCRMTLYLSKVAGLTGRRSSVCLQHALRLLEARKDRDGHGYTLQVVIYMPDDELKAALEQVQSRLVAGVASCSTQDV